MRKNCLSSLKREETFGQIMDHPNVVRIYGMADHEDESYLLMEFLGDGSLSDVIRKRDDYSYRQLINICYEVTKGLNYLHRQKIIHRDLKPSNVLLTARGILLTDFGLAEALEDPPTEGQTGVVAGTPAFMAPEQAVGEQAKIGPATDIYSLGLILYRLLTKNSAIESSGSRYALLKRMQNGEIEPPETYRDDLNQETIDILMRCLQREPDDRYATAGALNKDLREVIRTLRFEKGKDQPTSI